MNFFKSCATEINQLHLIQLLSYQQLFHPLNYLVSVYRNTLSNLIGNIYKAQGITGSQIHWGIYMSNSLHSIPCLLISVGLIHARHTLYRYIHYLWGICFVHSRALHTPLVHTGQSRSAPMRELDAHRAKIVWVLTGVGRDQGTTAPSPPPLSLGVQVFHWDPSLEPGHWGHSLRSGRALIE